MTRRNPQLPLSRREFLRLTMSAAAVAAGSACDFTNLALPGFPFTLGVASGDPLADRVVLWTRLATDPLALDGSGGMPNEPVAVVWEVANDEAFRSIVRAGSAIAHPSLGHSVHVDVPGLEPGRWYFYRFHTAGSVSAIGRTRTFPRADQAPALLRFASASCQDFTDGFYTSHAALAQEDLDFVAFLGDYIYESDSSGPARAHLGGLIRDLAGYRLRYAQYRGDANLRAAHANFPWIVTWDDHEVANNYAGLTPQFRADRPERNLTPEEFALLRAAGYQAWYENQPVRLLPPKSTTYPIYRSLDFGDLAKLCVLDTRQFRTDQDCDETEAFEGLAAPCPGFPDPAGTLLGAAQEAWLEAQLLASSSRWNVLAQQVVFSPTPLLGLFNFDQWDGYPVARARLVDFLQTRAIRNPVVLTGDIHAAGAAWIPADPIAFTGPVASELVATGISSSGLDPQLADTARTFLERLPHVQFFDAIQRGYIRNVVERDQWRADFRFVSTTAEPTATVATGISFVVEDGNPVPQPA